MSELNINEVTKEVLEIAKEKGFGDTPENSHTMEKFALLHSEVSEAYSNFSLRINADGQALNK